METFHNLIGKSSIFCAFIYHRYCRVMAQSHPGLVLRNPLHNKTRHFYHCTVTFISCGGMLLEAHILILCTFVILWHLLHSLWFIVLRRPDIDKFIIYSLDMENIPWLLPIHYLIKNEMRWWCDECGYMYLTIIIIKVLSTVCLSINWSALSNCMLLVVAINHSHASMLMVRQNDHNINSW